jgi:hypothetical protein
LKTCAFCALGIKILRN